MSTTSDVEPEIYVAQIKQTGKAMCACPVWNNKVPGQPRTCQHTQDLAAEYGIKEVYDWYGNDANESPVMQTAPHEPEVPQEVLPMFPIITTKEFVASKFPPSEFVIHPNYAGVRLLVTVDAESKTVTANGFSLVRGDIKKLGEHPLPRHITNGLLKFPTGIFDCKIYLEGGKSDDVYIESNQDMLCLSVIDVLSVEYKSKIDKSFTERREQLEELFWICGVSADDAIFLIPSIPASQEEMSRLFAISGFGGVLKSVKSVYSYGTNSVGSKSRWVLYNPPKVKKSKQVAESVVETSAMQEESNEETTEEN